MMLRCCVIATSFLLTRGRLAQLELVLSLEDASVSVLSTAFDLGEACKFIDK